jgi:hypothetical protein
MGPGRDEIGHGVGDANAAIRFPDSAGSHGPNANQSRYIPGNPPLPFMASIWRIIFFIPPPFIIRIIFCNR